MQRCREELTEGVKGYSAVSARRGDTRDTRKELPDHELCLFVKIRKAVYRQDWKKSKTSSDLLKKRKSSSHSQNNMQKNFKITDQS